MSDPNAEAVELISGWLKEDESEEDYESDKRIGIRLRADGIWEATDPATHTVSAEIFESYENTLMAADWWVTQVHMNIQPIDRPQASNTNGREKP